MSVRDQIRSDTPAAIAGVRFMRGPLSILMASDSRPMPDRSSTRNFKLTHYQRDQASERAAAGT